MLQRVYKYGTGDEIPEGAIYLSTQVETDSFNPNGASQQIRNTFVWHYFLVEVEPTSQPKE